MLTKNRYSTREMIYWTHRETIPYIVLMILITTLFDVFKMSFLHVPWTPVALIGTAVAFIIGFQNSAAYERIWEARKIWGGIVNNSRTFTMKLMDMITNEYTKNPESEDQLHEFKRTIVHRHIAWLTTLRYAMRQSRSWEAYNDHKTNRKWSSDIHIPERDIPLEEVLTHYLSEDEMKHILSKGNKSTALLFLQSKNLRVLKEKGLIWEFSFLELENNLQEFFTLQGKSERIKNFPYPRQYATLGYLFVRIFLLLLPFGLVPAFDEIGSEIINHYPIIGNYFIWLAVPFCTIVAWVFHTMERIGHVGENPFEGSANDVPISTISRGIEIDIRQMLGDDHESIPKPLPEQKNVQM